MSLKTYAILMLTAWMIVHSINHVDAKEATFYSDDLIGRPMANTKPFRNDQLWCASNDYPLGTGLKVSWGDKVVYVEVTVRCDDKTDIDLTKFAFQFLAPLEIGRLKGVVIEEDKDD